MHIENLLFLLIQTEISNTPLSDELRNTPIEEQLENLYLLAKRHDLSHILASALTKDGMLSDNIISQKLKNDVLRAVYRDSQRQYAYEQLVSILEERKIQYLPLKGVVISKYYPETWLRTSCDIDILLHEKDIQTVIETLTRNGFQYEKFSAAHYSMFSPGKVHIELHFTLKQRDVSSADTILNNVWNYAFPERIGSYGYQLTPEFFLIYHLAHMAKHVMHGGCGIRPFIDLWLIERNNSYDENELRILLEESGLSEFYRVSSMLSKVWMEGIEHTEQTRHLADYILHGGTYGTVDNSHQMQAAQGISKKRYFLRLAFLPLKKLQVIYPALKKHPWMYPLYTIRRWGRIFKRSKRVKAMHLLHTRNHVSDTDEGKARELLRQLGLGEK